MSTNPIFLIQQKMDSIDRRWRWLRFWEYFFASGAVLGLLWFGLEIGAMRKIITEPWLFYVLAGSVATGAVVAFLVIWVIIMATDPKRTWLADKLEKGCPDLLDRLNTLVFLEKIRQPNQASLKRKIEAQAAQVFHEKPLVNPLSSRRVWQLMGIFAFVLTVDIIVDLHYAPFEKLLHPPAIPQQTKTDTPFELTASNVTETKTNQQPWGEVRIVDPGRDVKLTKIDVLPLQIEMTASSTLQVPAWITSINGGAEVRHELAAPTEPQYAVYQPLVYLDELQVTDWDVVSYYATVKTGDPAEYASKIYFIEIRPFREDILKQTGGDGKKGKNNRDLLNDLIGLINQQTSILQQTHQYQQTTYATDELRKQDGKKLTDAETDLSSATDHFYGKIVAENENAPIGDILDHLAQAEQQMNKAVENLGEDIIPEAKQREQGALAELVACRKSFLKTISKYPNAFGDGAGSQADDGVDLPPTTAKESLKALSQVTEMHDRNQAALQALHQLNQRQRSLAQAASTKDNAGGQVTGQAESNLKANVDKLMQDNPDLFRAADTEKASLESDLSQAIANLNSNQNYEGQHFLDHAADDMNDLEKEVQKNYHLQQLSEAYKLKKIIDQNAQQLGQEAAKPGSLSPQDIKDLSDSAQRSTGTLKEITDNPQSGANFGPGLSQALSPGNQQALHQALDQLGQAQPGPGSQAAAGTAQGNLAKVSQAFEQGVPTLTKQIQGQDQLMPSPGSGLDQAMQQLQGLILAQQKKQPPSNQDQSKELGEILGDLEKDLSKDDTPKAADILMQIHNMQNKKDGPPINTNELKKLLDAVQTLSAEASEQKQDKPPGDGITMIDPSKFPPNYRDRIRTYYEQLSTHSQ